MKRGRPARPLWLSLHQTEVALRRVPVEINLPDVAGAPCPISRLAPALAFLDRRFRAAMFSGISLRALRRTLRGTRTLPIPAPGEVCTDSQPEPGFGHSPR